MSESAGRTTWSVLAFIAIAGTLLSLHPLRPVSAGPSVNCSLGGHVNQSCIDGFACTFNDSCNGNEVGAQCRGTANNSACDDFNDCTADTCNVSIGCQHDNQTGTSCDDGDPCTVNDQCNNGACTTSQAVNCSGASDQCNVRSCSTSGSDGNCDDNNALNNTPCDNGGEVKCQHQLPATCSMFNNSISNCTNAPDSDGDHICDADDLRPNLYDPSGYFYDEDTARIVPGGHVGVACVAGPCVGTVTAPLDGSNGQYAFFVAGLGTTEERYALTITPPRGCVLSAVCLASSTPLDPTGQPDPDAIGNYPAIGDPNSLSSNACTVFYTAMDLESSDPEVINNNIPVHCPPTSAPTVSHSGLAVMALLLTAVAALGLLRRKAPRA